MTFKQGKFYNDAGQVVPLEFGNKEQLQMIENVKALHDGVMLGSVLLGMAHAFKCPCGARLEFKYEDGKTIKCPDCFNKYKLFEWTDGMLLDLPCIKLI